MKAVIFIAVFLCAASAISGAVIADGQKVVCEDGVCMLVEVRPLEGVVSGHQRCAWSGWFP